ncbi:MAG: PRC-barrel domain-containing protein, partial [Bacteriovoracaceae bacterium]|nr:PRC-barrel domain-containing protein [Bacteriovoracaceae bacterium]
VDRNDFPETDDDEYYVADLLGLKVLENATGCDIGVVSDFYDNGQQVVLVLKLKDQLFDLLFLDQFVPEVDVEGGFIKVNLPEYID